jgi:hypothetical protein
VVLSPGRDGAGLLSRELLGVLSGVPTPKMRRRRSDMVRLELLTTMVNVEEYETGLCLARKNHAQEHAPKLKVALYVTAQPNNVNLPAAHLPSALAFICLLLIPHPKSRPHLIHPCSAVSPRDSPQVKQDETALRWARCWRAEVYTRFIAHESPDERHQPFCHRRTSITT